MKSVEYIFTKDKTKPNGKLIPQPAQPQLVDQSIFLSFFLSFFLIILSLPTLAQDPWFEDAHFDEDTLPRTDPSYSYFGKMHTPRGHLKVLVLTIGFDRWDYEGDSLHVFPDPFNLWPAHSSSGVIDYQGFPTNFDEVYYSSPDMFSPTANDPSVSNFYYQHSRTGAHEPFKVTYEFFPHRINVPILPSDEGDYSFDNFISRAYDTIQTRYANYNWQQYDMRTNRPNFGYDNSIDPTPDGKIDYVIMLFRFAKGIQQRYKWMNKFSQDGYTPMPTRTIVQSNDSTISFADGYVVQTGIRNVIDHCGIFIHEDGHSLYNAPHVFSGNSVVGEYFYTGTGWGAATGNRVFYSQSAWDRWWLNWIDIKYDLSDLQHNGDYWLRDFITTGDAMRLRLPTPDGQYVWFENRTGATVFDSRLKLLHDGADPPNPIPPAPIGLVGFIEAISDDRTSTSIFGKGANAMRVINPNGNFDYSWSSYRIGEWWNNRIYDYTTIQENPFGAHNPSIRLRDDFFGDSLNSPPDGFIKIDGTSNNTIQRKREFFDVIELDDELVYGPIGHDLAFSAIKKLSISTNPGLIAHLKYDTINQRLYPIYLHGLSVQVLQYQGSGVNRKAKIRVKYDDYVVDRDVRWCGNIILPAGVPLELKEGKTITLDKSGTPNRHTLTPAGDFINPTALTFEEGATFTLRANSNMYVRAGSTLHLEPNSKLTIAEGAKLYIRPNSVLQVDECAELEVLPGGEVIVETAGILQLSHSAILNVHDGQVAFNINNAAIIPEGFPHPNDLLLPSYHLPSGNYLWESLSYNIHTPLTIESGAHLMLNDASLQFSQGGSIEVMQGGTLTVFSASLSPLAGCGEAPQWQGIHVQEGGTLVVGSCAELELLSGGQLIVDEGGILQVLPEAILNVHDGQEAFSIHPNAIVPMGFVHPNDMVPPSYRVLNGIQTWGAKSYTLHHDLVVEPDARLNLNGTTLRFTQGKKIVVKQKAQLHANGSTLTSFTGCGHTGFWRGIQVEGNMLVPHTETSQGYLSIGAGTTISYAEIGVHVANNVGGSWGGGILHVAGATFEDNITAIEFAPYTRTNQSRISGSTFTTTGYLAQLGITPKRFISLKGITPVLIHDNTFRNTSPGSYSLTERGYGVLATDADVQLYTKFVSNTFTNLFTAVHAVSTGGVNSFAVENAVIESCFNGVHASGYPAPVVESCSIQLPYETYQDKVPTGISIAAMDGLSVTGNSITGSSFGFGIHIESLGRSSGLIWGNAIGHVDVGIMAIGPVNPIPEPVNTLQVQCNQLYGNRSADIYVVGDGMASEQGTKNTSASNQFEAAPSYNIFTSSYPITYYAYSLPYYPHKYNEHVKVMDSFDLADCGDGFGTFKPHLTDIAQQNDSLTQASQLLIALQDMGETDALVETVEGEENPLALRNALLRRSPLLSDTVMVTASADAVPLPNLMLAQVLMGNPQAAKSAAVLQALDERENTLPDYLMEAIHEAGSGFSPIDGAKAEVARHHATRDILTGRLLARFTADTLSKPYDSIRMLPDYHPDRIYRYLSAFTHVEQGNLPDALVALQGMAGESGLTPEQLQETEGVTQLVNVLAELEQAGIPLGHMDSLTRTTLEGLATQGVGIAALLASNALVIADTVPFLAQELAVGEAYSGTHQGEWTIFLELEPFPVTDYVMATYDMGREPYRNPLIRVVNSKGDMMYGEALSRSRFEVLVEVEGWRPGTYTVQLADGERVLAQRSFLILGHDEGSEGEEPETHELLSDIGVTLHPNPTDGQLTVEVRGCEGDCRFGYEVMTPSGITLLSGSGTGSKVLSLDHLSKGTYMVAVSLGGQRLVQPVVLR